MFVCRALLSEQNFSIKWAGGFPIDPDGPKRYIAFVCFHYDTA